MLLKITLYGVPPHEQVFFFLGGHQFHLLFCMLITVFKSKIMTHSHDNVI